MGSIRERSNRPKPYEAVWRDPDGHQRTKSFEKKRDAQRFLNLVEADKQRGTYIDPNAGKVTFASFAEEWLAAQTFDVSTHEAVTSRLRTHLLPTFGQLELRRIRPSTVQAWLRGRQETCAVRHVRVLLANLSSILGAAVDDGLIPKNPCAASSVKPPALDSRRVIPWTRDQVAEVTAALPARYQALATVAAYCGLRQGEAFGLAVEAVDFLRRQVDVRMQVKLVKGRPVFAPPKGGKTREGLPLPDLVGAALAEHIRSFPPVEVTLPWRTLGGEGVTAPLLFTSRERKAVDRTHFNPYVWKTALRKVGIEPTRANGMHALRHHYASVMLAGGVSIHDLAEWLGHADPGFTLRTYTHLMPESKDRARRTVDAILREPDVSQNAR